MGKKKFDKTSSKIPNVKDMVNKTGKQGGGDVLPNEKDILNIEGVIATVTAIPTSAPKKFNDSIVIYLDSLSAPTVKRLYTFSREGNAWFYVALT